jgi:hypothetical protein
VWNLLRVVVGTVWLGVGLCLVGFYGLAGGGAGVGGRGLSWFSVYGGEGWMGRERTSKMGLGKMVCSSFR